MEALLIVGVLALVLVGMGGGGEAQAAPRMPKVVYIVPEAHKSEGDATGVLLIFALGVIALLALGIPG